MPIEVKSSEVPVCKHTLTDICLVQMSLVNLIEKKNIFFLSNNNKKRSLPSALAKYNWNV